MKAIAALLIVQSIALGQPLPGGGLENGAPHRYLCGRSTMPVVIDGQLADPAWCDAPWTGYFGDIEGSLKPEPRYHTRVKMLWDDSCLYIGAEIEEPHVWATLTKRDTVIFYDNDFEVFIDPNGDNHEYLEFEMNALNTGWDLFLNKPYRDGGTPDDAWNIAGLKTAVNVHGTINDPADKDTGWCVEMAIPWHALQQHAHMPCPPHDGDQWRINFSRVEWDVDISNGRYTKVRGCPEHNWVWSPQWVIDMHWPELWGYLQFTNGKAAECRFRPDPTLPARSALMKIYYAQRDFYKKTGRWGGTLEAIGLDSLVRTPTPATLTQTDEGYRVVLNGLTLWQDSKLEWHGNAGR
jgi:hypothetical protein